MMKPLLTLICSLFVLGIAPIRAQISLLTTDLTSIGDVVTRYSDTIPAYGPGGSGPNQTWDFSSAVIEDTAVTTVVTVASTGFQSTFASSDYAMEGVEGSSWLYFEHDANSMSTTGAAGDLLGNGDIESPFSDDLLLHQFPRTYGSNFDDTYAFVTEASGAGLPTPIPVNQVRLTHTGHVYDTTDAYGTLITPYGTYDALRVKTVDYTHDILEIKLFSFSPWSEFSNTMDTSTVYAWHAKEEMLAIAEFTFDSLGNPARFTFSTVPPATTVGVQEDANDDLSIYPQPATDFLYLNGLKDFYNYSAEIISIDGRVCSHQQLGSTRISVATLPRGVYILRLISSDGIQQKPMRFVVER
ncbi:MAG: T9SS type A sorting domain-containing protein [Flavobacteriales bacterium]|nr:T9SS type A sorting domain-containing protein [Flavobacteriales bacterium]MCB9190527.1 T9SS type A sorting domain-containing protein [Flavobacteriales bacterium]